MAFYLRPYKNINNKIERKTLIRRDFLFFFFFQYIYIDNLFLLFSALYIVVHQVHIVLVWLLPPLQQLATAEQLVVQLVHAVHNMDIVELQLLIVVLYLMVIVVIQHVVVVSVVHDMDIVVQLAPIVH